MRLADRTALVTGASRGIGAAIARRLIGEGARVALVARTAGPLEALARELGPRAIPIAADLTAPHASDAVLERFAAGAGEGPDILVNNAGAFLIASMTETSTDVFRGMLDTNLVAPFSLARAVVGGMRSRGYGHVVSIGSVADRVVFPGNAAYAASKFGLRALHEVLREELRGSGVRATLVSPGSVDTELWNPIDPDNQPGFTPRAMMLDPQAVADAVLYALLAPPAVNIDELRLTRA